MDLAEVVVGAEIFPKILTCLKFPDEFVKVRAVRKKCSRGIPLPPPIVLMPAFRRALTASSSCPS